MQAADAVRQLAALSGLQDTGGIASLADLNKKVNARRRKCSVRLQGARSSLGVAMNIHSWHTYRPGWQTWQS
jgi:hypothetical protein